VLFNVIHGEEHHAFTQLFRQSDKSRKDDTIFVGESHVKIRLQIHGKVQVGHLSASGAATAFLLAFLFRWLVMKVPRKQSVEVAPMQSFPLGSAAIRKDSSSDAFFGRKFVRVKTIKGGDLPRSQVIPARGDRRAQRTADAFHLGQGDRIEERGNLQQTILA
jgi:hypothetical protein